MKGKYQEQDELIINASKEKVWNALTDTSVLHKWMTIVKHTDGKHECLNAVRSCDVEMNGKKGKVREKCVMFEEPNKIGWEMEYDTFGFGKMFNNYGFSFELEVINPNSTRVINKGFYDPKNFLVALMNILMMKRKSSEIRRTALNGIKQLVESKN